MTNHPRLAYAQAKVLQKGSEGE
eukprot:SAG31_NODE_16147_length_721_cov_1.009646_2_plen_22_part_01